jgi:transcriptional regulator with GAF, ATPase, and Fis domain
MSDEYQRFIEMSMKAARYSDMTVLITGETGTGKTRIARMIHRASPRSKAILVEIDCTSISRSIAESELFGHERGAFTGADQARLGRIRSANGGTLFLDEVGDLEPPIQAKLLKVMDDRCVVPVGSEKKHSVDVRIIAATNRNLDEMVLRGEFRRDLLERLSQLKLHVPPLRERPRDIREIALASLESWNSRYGEAKALEEGAIEAMESYEWPGNVRELENAVSYACARSEGRTVGQDSLPGKVLEFNGSVRSVRYAPRGPEGSVLPLKGISLKAHLRNIERSFFEQALDRSGGNASKAAALLGMKGSSFRKALKERHAPIGFSSGLGEFADASLEG